MTRHAAGCLECRIVKGGERPHDLAPFARGRFVVHPRGDDAGVPGWMIVAPMRHVEQWDDLTARELSEIGPLIADVTAALRAETAAEKVYVSVFAEMLAHLHVHVIARTADVPPDARGPRVFLSRGAPPAEAARIGAGVLGRLAPRRRPTRGR